MKRLLKNPILLALAAALITAGIATAHADFVRSDPQPNSVIATAPGQVTIWFNEPIEAGFSEIKVLFADGSTIDLGDSTVSPADPTQLTVSLNTSGPGRQGTYLVSWRVLSSVDGHITSGAWVFSVGEVSELQVEIDTGGAVTSPFDMLARALIFVGQSLLAGSMLFRWLVWRPALAAADLKDRVDERSIPRGKRIVVIALGLALFGSVLSLLVQASLAQATIFQWLSTRVGRIWIGRVATLGALAVLGGELASTGRRREGTRRELILDIALGWLGLQLLLTTSLTSHSAAITTPPVVPVVADWLHLIATSLWVGGLAQMAFLVPFVAKSLNKEDRAWLWLETVIYFSTVAAFGIGILLVTGSYMSSLHIGDWSLVLSTIYGRSLLFKLALASVAMLLGAYNLLVVKPQLDRAVDKPKAKTLPPLQHRFRRLVAVEAIVALAVLASAGILTALPRSIDPQPAASSDQALELTTQADELQAALTIDPDTSGPSGNTFGLRLTQDGQPVVDASDVTLRFTYLNRSLGTTEAAAALDEESNEYRASGPFLSLPGDWQIEASVRRPDAFDSFPVYRVKIGLDKRIGPVGQPTPIESITSWLSIYGTAFGGALAIVLGLIWIVLAMKASRNALSQIALMIPTALALPVGMVTLVTFFGEATPGLTLTNPFLPDDQSLAAGKEVWDVHCAVCHGEAGRGDGPAAAEVGPRLPDFADGHIDIHSDGDVFYWIQNGFPNIPDSPMPAFAGTLNDDETWHLVNYVRRLRNQAGDEPPAPLAPQPAATPAQP